MRNLSAIYILFLMLGFSGALWAQDSLPKIIIGDIHVYESADSIVGEGIQGNVSYDASTNTLFLNDAVIPSLWAYRTDGYFKVKLSGNNSITRMISCNDSCAFFGPGTLTLGNASVGIALNCARTDYLALTEGATLEITASGTGIYTLYDDIDDPVPHYPLLVVNNSSLIVTAPYCCQFVWNWWLSESHVVAPQNFECQPNSWTFLSSGTIRDYLEIRPGTVGIPTHETVEWQALGVKGGVYIENLPENQNIEVVNILGQAVCRSKITSPNTFIPLKTGIYFVRANNHTVKTVVN